MWQYILQELVRRGIPHHFRGMAWQLLCSAHESKDKAKYADYMKRQSACEKVIRRDIARTYPEHDFFKKKDGIGQEALFNVMKAYSIHDREVGYCQVREQYRDTPIAAFICRYMTFDIVTWFTI